MSWRTAASLLTLREQIDAAVPGRSTRSDGTIGDTRHCPGPSDHCPNGVGVVRAIDLTHDALRGANMVTISRALAASRDPRIKYLIFNGQILSATVRPWTWRTYGGSNPHRTHLHVSVSNLSSVYDNDRAWSLPGSMQPFVINPQEAEQMEALVRGIQEALEAAGHDPGPTDGRWGPRTQSAFRDGMSGGFAPETSLFLRSFAGARPSDARGSSLWHVLAKYRADRSFFNDAA